MARLPAYVNPNTISTGGISPIAPITSEGKALDNLGSALGQLGGELYTSDLRQQAKDQADLEASQRKAEADATKRRNLDVEVALMDYKNDVEKELVNREAAASYNNDGAKGYFDSASQFATTRAEAYVKRFEAYPEYDHIRQRFLKATDSQLDKAYKFEVNQAYKFMGEKSQERVDDLKSAIASDPANYERSVKEWNDFVNTSLPVSDKVAEGVRNKGIRELQVAQAQAAIARDPDKYRALFSNAFKAGEAIPEDTPEHIKTTILNAKAAGVDPAVMLGIGNYESRLNPAQGNPIGKDGKPMSSAVGMFQVIASPDTLAALGISEKDRYDVDKVSAGLSRYIQRNTEKMQASGIDPTPGKQYMMWNVGEGLAWNILRANPNESIDNVVYRTYGNRLTKSGELFADVVLRNNPSLYRSGMTVGQVLQNYDAKMAQSMKEVEKYATREGVTTDEQAQRLFSQVLPSGYDKLTAKDAANLATMAETGAKKRLDDQVLFTRGAAILNGDIVADPGNKDDHKAVSKLLEQRPDIARNMLTDDGTAVQARQIIERARFIPDEFKGQLEAVVLNGTKEEKMRAYTFLADIYQKRPDIFAMSKLDGELGSRIKAYVSYLDDAGYAMSPAKALEKIEYDRSGEAKKDRAALKDTLKDELKSFDRDTVSRKIADTYLTPSAVSDNQAGIAHSYFVDRYTFYRDKDKSKEEAEALATADARQSFGTSSINGGLFMQYPPEKVDTLPALGPNGGNKNWIKDQVATALAADLLRRGLIQDTPKASDGRVIGEYNDGTPIKERIIDTRPVTEKAKDFEWRLVPRIETAQDIQAGKPPRYELWYRNPKTGSVDIIADRFWTPDVPWAISQAEEKARAADKAVREANQARADIVKKATPVGTTGPLGSAFVR